MNTAPDGYAKFKNLQKGNKRLVVALQPLSGVPDRSATLFRNCMSCLLPLDFCDSISLSRFAMAICGSAKERSQMNNGLRTIPSTSILAIVALAFTRYSLNPPSDVHSREDAVLALMKSVPGYSDILRVELIVHRNPRAHI